jgi:hypothetical protein
MASEDFQFDLVGSQTSDMSAVRSQCVDSTLDHRSITSSCHHQQTVPSTTFAISLHKPCCNCRRTVMMQNLKIRSLQRQVRKVIHQFHFPVDCFFYLAILLLSFIHLTKIRHCPTYIIDILIPTVAANQRSGL